jgi:hypothetical protein
MMKKLLKWFGIEDLNASLVNLDAFSSGQVGSKLWMISELETCLSSFKDAPEKGYRIWILAGWYGVTNLLLRARSIIPVEHVHSIDCDPTCLPIADRVNKFWEWQSWQFKAHTADANVLVYNKDNCPHIVINTAVEHFTSKEWFDRIPKGTLVVLQACDLPHDTHVHAYACKDDLLNGFKLSEVLYDGTMVFAYPEHDMQRFMVIGIK